VLKSITLLGTLPSEDDVGSDPSPAILILQKTPFDAGDPSKIISLVDKVEVIETNDIYFYMLASLSERGTSTPDVKINVIVPATDLHIQKYSTQRLYMVSETPELYRSVTKPYTAAIPASRLQWVRNVLDHVTEADQILFEDASPEKGYILLPDPKWDRNALSALYLVAIAHSSSIKSMRDLRKEHIPMLKSIKREATRIVQMRWGIEPGGLRFYIHYQPSYYQFHVHVVTTAYDGLSGMNVGQAHLLEDVISLLEIDSETGPSIFEKMTLTYVLGDKHGLYPLMKGAGAIGAL